MKGRPHSPFHGPPSGILRWIPMSGEETHSVDAKMSDTLLHFVDPLLEIEDNPDIETTRHLLQLGVTIWNLGALEMVEWKGQNPTGIDAMTELRRLQRQPGAPASTFQITEALLHRRRTLFGRDLRMIVDFELTPDAASPFRLRCSWMLPEH